ncbi:putative exported phosphatase [Photobacterium sp. SKA34]|uniref:endonuclease/exonuclease/phosphatase family protein n=1 Tax=Photobacterium sp. SKA34 TaxID=121723 RepID=UPI00006AF7B0|nr:endonuclease/exonuclease/phosphatase family protein [Photobacterium sp. SKA34]EAR54944.1 putative exported phosphatase [Photobacterium sp. SKA34]
MTKQNIKHVITAALFSVSTFSIQAQELSVMSWNSWVGPTQDGFSKKHAKRVAHDVAAIKPDVYVSIETYGKGHLLRKAFAKAHHVNTDDIYYYTISCRDNDGKPTFQGMCKEGIHGDNLAIMSIYPIVDVKVVRDAIEYPHVNDWNFGAVKLDVNGQFVWVVDTWLDSANSSESILDDLYEAARHDGSIDNEKIVQIIQRDKVRLNQAREIVEQWIPELIANADQEPVILAGDHNTSPRLDWSPKNKDMHFGITIPYQVSKIFTKAGFKDAFREMHPNVLTHTGKSWSPQGGDIAPNRIDYIYYKGSKLQALESVTIDSIAAGTTNDTTSDHSAVFARFKFV